MGQRQRLTNEDRDMLQCGLTALLQQEQERILDFARAHIVVTEELDEGSGEVTEGTCRFHGGWAELVAALGDQGGILPQYRQLEERVSKLCAKIKPNKRKPRKPTTKPAASGK